LFINQPFKTTALFFISLLIFSPLLYAGDSTISISESDSGSNFALFSFFDLRDRESFVQLTNIESFEGTVHLQIFDVSNNCNENNFFDTYTGNDTHVYNMRDIQTNNGNPSGVVLPDGAYGFVSIISINPTTGTFADANNLIGNFRILDNNGYEYRTNSVNPFGRVEFPLEANITFNFNTKGGVILSDVVGIVFSVRGGEIVTTDLQDNYFPAEINILNEDEVIFSCRNVVFACTDQNNPLLEALLGTVNNSCCGASSSVASFEYGINDAIPHSKGGELLCPGNNINNGIVKIDRFLAGEGQDRPIIGIIGLNNGNGRGSMDSFWNENTLRSQM